jgi:hypothetical protein
VSETRTKVPAHRLIYRHVTGLEYDGEPRTDATWLDEGTTVVHVSGKARRWHYRPRLHRAGVRLAWTAAGALDAYGLAVAPGVTVVADEAAVAAGVVYGGYRAAEAAMRFRHHRRVVRPLSKALARPLENQPANVLRKLSVPLRPDTPGRQVVVPIPDGWHGDRREVLSIISARLGGEWQAEWRLSEAPFTAVFTRAPEPPDRVTFADLLDAFAACEPGELVVGLDNRGRPYKGDFVRDEPMWGLSIGSGGGKSLFLWSVAAQLVAQGATITAVDPKYVSLDPLQGVPGVRIANDPRNVGAMWEAIADFRAEMESRFEAWTKDRTLEFPRMVLFIEEGNMFSDLSKSYWREIKGPKDPAQPPVWQDIAAILRMGRQANANVVAVFQRMTDKATGGESLRDSFGFRMLGRYTWQAWASLVGTTPVPKSSKKRGRFIVVDNGEHTWIHAPYCTPEEIHAFCLRKRAEQGWEMPGSDGDGSHAEGGVTEGERPSRVGSCSGAGVTVTPAVSLVKDSAEGAENGPETPLYSLPEALREGIVSGTYNALRKAKERGQLPPPAAPGRIDRWTADQLAEFERTRPRAVADDDAEEGAA